MSDEKKAARPLKLMIRDEQVQERFAQMLGKNAPAFLMSVLNCVSNSDKLAKAEPESVLMAAAVAATLDLPIDPNLGMAYIVPYVDNSRGGITIAQFQIGYKGIIALCLRSSQYLRLNVEPVYEGELGFIDRLSGDIQFNWNQDNDARNKLKMIGVVAYFKLTNGFEKMLYMTDAELEAHGKKYSQSYKKGFGLWKDDPIAMKKKTAIKLLIEKFGAKSVQIQHAIKTDQAVIEDYNGDKVRYIDNGNGQPVDLDELNAKVIRDRVKAFIENATTLEQLEECYSDVPDAEIGLLYTAKRDELIAAANKTK